MDLNEINKIERDEIRLVLHILYSNHKDEFNKVITEMMEFSDIITNRFKEIDKGITLNVKENTSQYRIKTAEDYKNSKIRTVKEVPEYNGEIPDLQLPPDIQYDEHETDNIFLQKTKRPNFGSGVFRYNER